MDRGDKRRGEEQNNEGIRAGCSRTSGTSGCSVIGLDGPNTDRSLQTGDRIRDREPISRVIRVRSLVFRSRVFLPTSIVQHSVNPSSISSCKMYRYSI